MKKTVRLLLIILAVVIAVSAAGFCVYVGEQVYRSSLTLTTNERTAIDRAGQLSRFGMNAEYFESVYSVLHIKLISSLDGHEIPADYISRDGEKNKDTVILVHGLGGNRVSNYPVAELFLQHGWNVLTYDQRATAENLAEHNTFGYLERYDTINYVSYVDKLLDADKRIVLWGTSFGGATVGMAMADEFVNSRVCAAILDCPVSSMEDMVRAELESVSEDTGLPVGFLLWTGGLALKRHLGFSLDDAEVTDYIHKSQIPLLVINSKADTVTPQYMGQNIFFAAGTPNKSIYTVSDSSHANVYFDHRVQYESRVFALIDSTAVPEDEAA